MHAKLEQSFLSYVLTASNSSLCSFRSYHRDGYCTSSYVNINISYTAVYRQTTMLLEVLFREMKLYLDSTGVSIVVLMSNNISAAYYLNILHPI